MGCNSSTTAQDKPHLNSKSECSESDGVNSVTTAENDLNHDATKPEPAPDENQESEAPAADEADHVKQEE
ncbi:hypothetical protein Q7C36_014217 [Tachysurus vachellii]|uniref:Uncharacterized protein n=1 Tax=Tachysurus vachellii TaxID=175792 RepID=A0AA88MGS3_TACVA|nr:hypothetical protein Q7C36_014217 [Tachysurus vachellii]